MRTHTIERPRIAVFCWSLFFLALALAEINRYGFASDESASHWLSSMPLPQLFAHLRVQDAVFAFYYLVLHLWSLAGHSVPYIRALSLLFALASIPVVYRIAAYLFDRSVAFWSVAALCTSSLLLQWACIARVYTMEFFFCALAALYSLYALEERPAVSAAWLFALFSILAIFAHPMAIAWGAALTVAAIVFGGARRAMRRLAFPLLGIAIFAIVPLAFETILNRNGAQIDWIAPLTLHSLAQSLFMFTSWGSLISALLVAALLIVSIATCPRNGRQRLVTILIWLSVSILTIVAISIKKPVTMPYYYLYAWIALAIAMGVAFSVLAKRVHVGAAWSVWALCAVLTLWWLSGHAAHENFRTVAKFLHMNVSPQDGVAVHASFQARTLYYALEENNDVGLVRHWAYPTDPLNTFLERPDPRLLRSASERYRTLWLVLSHDGLHPSAAITALMSAYPHRTVHVFGHERVIELSR